MSPSTRSRIPELQAAVRALSGVGAATVRWPEPEGPATLRIEFETAADRQSVAASVLDALRDVAGVDLSSLRVALPPPPGMAGDGATTAPAPDRDAPGNPASPDGLSRPVFHAIEVTRTALDVAVSVTLTSAGRQIVGRAEGLATRQTTPRVAAAATLVALGHLLPADTRLHLDWLEIHDAEHPVRPGVVQVAVAMLSPAGEEAMIGSALLRDDAREGAVRATLDAVNRRLALLAVADRGARPAPTGQG